jgi:hypothetical protein
MKTIAALLAICITALFVAGCTAPVPPLPGITPAPTGTSSIPGLIPQPTSVVPPYYNLSVQVQKNTISTNPYISVILNGGQGLGLATQMEVTVIRSDGIVEQQSISSVRSGGLTGGTELIFNGTIKSDRVIANASFVDGNTYTIKDVLVPFQNLNPTPGY